MLVSRQLSGALFESLEPPREMLISCLHSRLSVDCRIINTHLLHILTHDHCLLDCFTIIRVTALHFCYFVVGCKLAFCSVSMLCTYLCYAVPQQQQQQIRLTVLIQEYLS